MIIIEGNEERYDDLKYSLICLISIVYISFSDMYYYLPPFFSLLFLLFDYLYGKKNKVPFLLTILSILFYESEKNYLMLSMIVFTMLSHKFITPYFRFAFNAEKAFLLVSVIFSYMGSYLFMDFVNYLLGREEPYISFIDFADFINDADVTLYLIIIHIYY